MKSNLITAYLLLTSWFSFCQENLKEYQTLINDGWKLRSQGEYQNAATLYSSAIKLEGNKSRPLDIHRAAFLWALVNYPDSAFYYLNIMSTADIKFEDFVRVATDEDYASIKDDFRWKLVTDKIFNNAASRFKSRIKSYKGNVPAIERIFAAAAWTIKNNSDSVFYHLNIAAGASDLTFEQANEIVTTTLYGTIQKDIRWQALKNKMFLNLNRKYLPAFAFSKSASTKHILIDEGHYNLHTIEGTYAALAGVLSSCGLHVRGHRGQFTRASLANANMLIIANPFPDIRDSLERRAAAVKEPFRWSAAAARSAFLKSEVTAIHDWVNKGGSLLLILDHAPHAKTGGLIAAAFKVDCRNVATYDKLSSDPEVDTLKSKTILFTRSKGLIGAHSILQGVDSVTTYTGESILGPARSDALLILPTTAIDMDWEPSTKKFRYSPSSGRVQGVALRHGRGRVIVLGEAAMTNSEATSRPNRGNWQLTLNILRWLAREKMD